MTQRVFSRFIFTEATMALIYGSKFAACNSKSNNFTKNKLDDRIKWLNGHIEEYLRIFDDADRQEDFDENPENLTKELIEEKLREARE